MHVTGDVTRPPIKVPKRPHVQGVPTTTDQCGRAIIVIDKLELSAMQCEMAQKLGIVRLFQDYAEQSPARHCYPLTNLRWNELRQIFDCDALLFHRIAIA